MDVKIQIKLHVLCNYISFYSLQLKKSKSRSGQFEARDILEAIRESKLRQYQLNRTNVKNNNNAYQRFCNLDFSLENQEEAAEF